MVEYFTHRFGKKATANKFQKKYKTMYGYRPNIFVEKRGDRKTFVIVQPYGLRRLR